MLQPTFHGFSLRREDFHQSVNGRTCDLFILHNGSHAAALTNYGARIIGLITPDKNNKPVDVVLGFSTLKNYLETKEVYHGAIIGRYANRIANGSFHLNGKAYHLPVNNGRNHLHGGPNGFHNVVWDTDERTENSIRFSYRSQDGEEGYPGTVIVTVDYTLVHSALQITFQAETDQTTVINLTNHAYFNLNGQGSVMDHNLEINADHFTPINEFYIPTGDLQQVAASPFDFRVATAIGARINDDDQQLKNGGGYDHNFVLNKTDEVLSTAAIATGDRSGIRLEILTTEPGVQLYTGNFMHGENMMKGGFRDEYRTAFCLETQHFPDSPNQPAFPSVVLNPGEIYRSETILSFTT